MIPQLAVLADSANLSQEGKLNLLGEFNTLFAAEVPVAHPVMWFVAKMQIDARDFGQHRILLQVVSEDGDTVLPPMTAELDLPNPENYTGDPLFFRFFFRSRMRNSLTTAHTHLNCAPMMRLWPPPSCSCENLCSRTVSCAD